MNTIQVKTGKRVRKAAIKARYGSQYRLARVLGVTTAAIARWVAGELSSARIDAAVFGEQPEQKAAA